MKCDDCIHYDVCEALAEPGVRIDAIQCDYYFDKSRFVELPLETVVDVSVRDVCISPNNMFVPWKKPQPRVFITREEGEEK